VSFKEVLRETQRFHDEVHMLFAGLITSFFESVVANREVRPRWIKEPDILKSPDGRHVFHDGVGKFLVAFSIHQHDWQVT